MYENRIKHLEVLHQSLDKQIRGLESTGRFGDTDIKNLKKQKLSIKDELADLRRKQYEYEHETLDWDEDR